MNEIPPFCDKNHKMTIKSYAKIDPLGDEDCKVHQPNFG